MAKLTPAGSSGKVTSDSSSQLGVGNLSLIPLDILDKSADSSIEFLGVLSPLEDAEVSV